MFSGFHPPRRAQTGHSSRPFEVENDLVTEKSKCATRATLLPCAHPLARPAARLTSPTFTSWITGSQASPPRIASRRRPTSDDQAKELGSTTEFVGTTGKEITGLVVSQYECGGKLVSTHVNALNFDFDFE